MKLEIEISEDLLKEIQCYVYWLESEYMTPPAVLRDRAQPALYRLLLMRADVDYIRARAQSQRDREDFERSG